MAPTILIVGATGNTGRSVVETLSDSINNNKTLAGYRIIALTRNSDSLTAQKLGKLSNVTIEEKNWVDISPEWLKERNVVKAFPNVFTSFVLGPALEFIKQYCKDGKQNMLLLMLDGNTPLGCIHSDEVGRFAAILLAQEDHSIHNKKKYELNGPMDINGKQIVKLIEEHIRTEVKDFKFRDMSFVDAWADSVKANKSLILFIKGAPNTDWEGKCSTATTSKEFLELSPPKITPAM
ncbi:hypothetical protein BGAL_0046g00430 [Botrytis galanthina]|uniref:NmrA-like domain-containing protein n=1 Tax=Botrytis galanthina TaxID=278940 RepID=A0A4S8R6K5_9HELO|nr:hypothetical protein BGAL_0046g00430 [Botrytis galanthina]